LKLVYCFYREQVRVNGFGLFLMFIFPGAYVDLHTDHLEIATSIKQLRIFCAGVWHNVVVVLISLLILYFHPYVVYMLFIKTASVAQINEVFSLNIIKSNVLILKHI
jgi:S2P endopeptidase